LNSKLPESGHYSIAGFVYQLIGSAVEGFQVLAHSESDTEIEEALYLERVGQDLFGKPVGSDKSPRLIQFKYSSKKESKLLPSDLRTVLEAFLRSVRSAEKETDDFTYELVTNRNLHKDVEVWFEEKEHGSEVEIRNWLDKYPPDPKKDQPELFEIFKRLNYHHRTAAYHQAELLVAAKNLGILDIEMQGGVNRLVGFLGRRSSEPTERQILPAEIRHQLAGHPNACELFSHESVALRRKKLVEFRDGESPPPIIFRNQVEKVADAILSYPIVALYGNGGCGKSVAMCDAALNAAKQADEPPGFCLVGRANGLTAQFAMTQINGWRRCSPHPDGIEFSNSFKRLSGAFENRPVLVVCIDGIDETEREKLPPDVLGFVRELIRLAVESRMEIGSPVLSVVLTSRLLSELRKIPRNEEGIAPEHCVTRIKFSDFDDEELQQAAVKFESVADDIANRIIQALDKAESLTIATESKNRRAVSTSSIEIIRHPVLWRAFSKLTNQQQHECLDGSDNGLNQLGSEYVSWFQRKAADRIPNLQREDCVEALVASAVSFDQAAQVGNLNEHWTKPIVAAAGISGARARRYFREAISAGMIDVEEDKTTWRWRHSWFCRFLVSNQGGI